ncbi:MAG: crossover junction endodeoxyribonuclease RuvC [Sphaerochaetaceae bacterium]|jgi:crossover junction endodeoxyribonuclease RuvC|nr:crossover junction endodeoxyribonuclease RuvC [Spirochaetaceae bacterium]MDY6343278.1 crossover junction endodeoxyribonuclease RuvC [Sphaerochaetaceae bacterium]
MLILGIDPGLANTGWGVVDTNGLRHRPVSYSVITTSPDMTEQMRIHTIATAIGQVADHYHTQYCGIEDIYFTRSKADKNITNSQSAILVAKVIGAISHQLAMQQVPVRLFSPMTIKSTVTGTGRADKNQVQQMVRLLLGLKEIPKPDHAADALAVGLTLATFNIAGQRMHV